MSSETKLSSFQAEFDIDLAIEERERQEAVKHFRHLCHSIVRKHLEDYSILHKSSEVGYDGLCLFSKEATIPSQVNNIKLRASLLYDENLAVSSYCAAIEGTVSQKTNPNHKFIYNFVLDPEGFGEDKRHIVHLEEIQRAIKRAEFIEKILENRFLF